MVFLISDLRFSIAMRSKIVNLKPEISKEVLETTESDSSDYLSNLRDYEDRLARGEIKW